MADDINDIPKKRGRPRKTPELATMENTPPAKQTRNRPDLANFGQENVEPGDNSRFLRHALATLNMPPIDISDPKQVEDRITWYFLHCADNEMKPTVKGLCNAIGISRNTLRTWYNEEYRGSTHSPMIKKAYDLLEELWEDYMLNGKINPVSGIFLGRNHWGYQDKIDLVVTPNNTMEAKNPQEIEAKYAELPDDF